MISSLTNRGKLRFMVYDGALNAGIFLRFLKRLVRGAQRKIFLVVDNLRPHRAKIVAAWVAANLDKIELVYLPPYAPEHNPDEFVNNDVKQAMARRQAPKDKAELKKGLTSYMRGLQKRPAKIRAFFQAPTVRYAARFAADTYLNGGLVIDQTLQLFFPGGPAAGAVCRLPRSKASVGLAVLLEGLGGLWRAPQ